MVSYFIDLSTRRNGYSKYQHQTWTWSASFRKSGKMYATYSVCDDDVQIQRQRIHATGHKGGERCSKCDSLILTASPHKCEPKELIFIEVNGSIQKTFGRSKFRVYAISLHRTGEDILWIGSAGQLTAKLCAEDQHAKSIYAKKQNYVRPNDKAFGCPSYCSKVFPVNGEKPFTPLLTKAFFSKLLWRVVWSDPHITQPNEMGTQHISAYQRCQFYYLQHCERDK